MVIPLRRIEAGELTNRRRASETWSIWALPIRYDVRDAIGPPRTKGESSRWRDICCRFTVSRATCERRRTQSLICVSVDEAAIGQAFRENSGRSVAALIRVFGDIDVAEDAVQEAFTVALRRWARDGLPPNPGGWITTTARKRAIDRLRRTSRERELLALVAAHPSSNEHPDTPEGPGPMQDDQLRLIFTCCHPALAPDARVALTLRLLGG